MSAASSGGAGLPIVDHMSTWRTGDSGATENSSVVSVVAPDDLLQASPECPGSSENLMVKVKFGHSHNLGQRPSQLSLVPSKVVCVLTFEAPSRSLHVQVYAGLPDKSPLGLVFVGGSGGAEQKEEETWR